MKESIEKLNNLVTFGNNKDKMARKLEKFDTRKKNTIKLILCLEILL
jgi:hypothetical protein